LVAVVVAVVVVDSVVVVVVAAAAESFFPDSKAAAVGILAAVAFAVVVRISLAHKDHSNTFAHVRFLTLTIILILNISFYPPVREEDFFAYLIGITKVFFTIFQLS